MRHLICAGFAAIILSGCINDPEEQTYTLSLPLNVGNQWEYESITYFINSQLKNDTLRDSSHIFLSITDVKTNQAGNPVFEFKDSSKGNFSYDYYEKRADGLYLYALTFGGIHALWKSSFQNPDITQTEPALFYAPTSFKSGDEWIYDTLVIDNGKIALKKFFRGIEKVVTKAGTFDCYKFETTANNNEKRYHYFYPGIGLVKKEVVTDSVAISDADFKNIEYITYVSQNLLVSAN